jgi:Ca-activated chloride channel family protein
MRDLGDYQKLYPTDATEREITALGLSYNLLSDFTSFIAIDRVARNQAGEVLETVTQPLPLPQGVSQSSFGGEISTSPEPETWALLLIAIIPVFVTLRMRSRFMGGELR